MKLSPQAALARAVVQAVDAHGQAVTVEDDDLIRPGSLGLAPAEELGVEGATGNLGLREQLRIIEKQIVLQTLGRVDWVRKKAAQALAIDPRNLSYFLKKHDISEPPAEERRASVPRGTQ